MFTVAFISSLFTIMMSCSQQTRSIRSITLENTVFDDPRELNFFFQHTTETKMGGVRYSKPTRVFLKSSIGIANSRDYALWEWLLSNPMLEQYTLTFDLENVVYELLPGPSCQKATRVVEKLWININIDGIVQPWTLRFTKITDLQTLLLSTTALLPASVNQSMKYQTFF